MSGCASAEPFALQVLGNSMSPEFSEGCVVIVDPGAPLCHCLLYTSPSPRDLSTSRMPSSA